MRQLRFAVVLLTLLFATQVHAEPGGGDYYTVKPKPVPELELSYKLTADMVRVDFDIEDSIQWKAMMQAYPGEQFFKKIQGLPGIENIQFTPGKHEVDDKYHYKDMISSKRQSSLMVRVQGSAPFSLLFSVDETLKRCKEYVVNEEDGDEEVENSLSQWVAPDLASDSLIGAEAPCKMETSMVVKGPIAVYGTIPGNFANRGLLMNQISFNWSMKTDYTKKDTELDSFFKVTRTDFPVALQKMLKWTQGGNNPFAEVFLSNPQRNALVQIGRILKEKNKEILKGQ